MSQELLNLLRHDSYGSVRETLDFWLEECSLDALPPAEEIAQWCAVLQQRGGKFAHLADQCRTTLLQEP